MPQPGQNWAVEEQPVPHAEHRFVMVSMVLRVRGLSHLSKFSTYHRVLNRAVWSSLAVSHVLLGLLIGAFVPRGSVVSGVDETLERRRGAKIAAKGI
jgi:hypothetical protein